MSITVPPRRGRRPAVAHPQRERAHVRPVVLQAARELFRQTPSVLVSQEQIAARAGVTRYTLAKHFASKEEIFRESRSAMLSDLAELISEEISTGCEPIDGLYRFLQLCCRVFTDRRNLELRFSLVHELKAHPWLEDAYRRQIFVPLVKVCETFLLYKSVRDTALTGAPRLVAEQIVMLAVTLADTHLSAPTGPEFSSRLVEQHFQFAARAYAGVFDPGEPAATTGFLPSSSSAAATRLRS